MATNGWHSLWPMSLLRINGYSVTADSKAIYHYVLKLFGERSFDMERLVPWLQEIVRPRDAAPR
jgi:hypothetical protein